MFWKRNKKSSLFAIVSESEAKTIPYPYVYIEKDGTVRELHASERKHLETPYYPTDGSRPYVKNSYHKKMKEGDMRGYCLRSKIPSHVVIHDPPIKDPTVLSEQEFLEYEIELAKEHGFEYIEEDGKIIFQRKNKKY
jgi:hypothetical protein